MNTQMKEKLVFFSDFEAPNESWHISKTEESFIKEAGTKNNEIIWEVHVYTEDLRTSDLSSHSLNYLGQPPRKKDNTTRINFMTSENLNTQDFHWKLQWSKLCSLKKSFFRRPIK